MNTPSWRSVIALGQTSLNGAGSWPTATADNGYQQQYDRLGISDVLSDADGDAVADHLDVGASHACGREQYARSTRKIQGTGA